LNREIKQLNTKLENMELERLEQDRSKQLEEYESQLAEKNQSIEKLEARKDGLLDSLIHIQKLMQGFEVLIEDKNETIQEQEGKIADLEAIVEDSVDKANKLKELEKERKESQKQLKHLQVTLQDWETRQFSNVKLIAGLQKEKAALEKKVKDFEENHTGAEEELYDMSVKIRNLEKEVKRLGETLEEVRSELSQTKARLQAKTVDLSFSVTKNEELELKIRDLEREVRNKENSSEELEQLKQTVTNKEAELVSKLLNCFRNSVGRNRVECLSLASPIILSKVWSYQNGGPCHALLCVVGSWPYPQILFLPEKLGMDKPSSLFCPTVMKNRKGFFNFDNRNTSEKHWIAPSACTIKPKQLKSKPRNS